METIVIGHRNPDQDAISAAVAYAHLKQAQGWEGVTAGRAGNLTVRIEFVLGKFGVPAPPTTPSARRRSARAGAACRWWARTSAASASFPRTRSRTSFFLPAARPSARAA